MHHFGQIFAKFCAHVFDCGGIDIAASRAHHNAFKGREAHRRIHTFSVLDRRKRASVSKVADDDFFVAAEPLSRLARDILVRSAVETVFSHLIFVVDFVRNAVHKRLRRHRRVESRVENEHHGNVHNFPARLDAGNIAGHVQRSKVDIFLALCDDVVVHDHAALKIFAAVEHAMTDRADFLDALNRAVLFV